MSRTKNGAGLGVMLLLGLTASGAWAEEPSLPTGSQALHGLQLAGTVEGASQQLTGAVFENSLTKKQTAYRIGDLVDGATIVEIKRQQVVLKRGEELVVVRITGGSPGQAAGEPAKSAPDAAIQVPAGDSQQARQFVISKVIPPYDPRVEKLKTVIPRNDVHHFIDNFQSQLKDEEPLLVTTSLGPAVSVAGIDPEIRRSLRLESTDLIVGISGMGVDSLDRFRQILDMLGGNRVIIFNMAVLRGEVIQPMYYAVQ